MEVKEALDLMNEGWFKKSTYKPITFFHLHHKGNSPEVLRPKGMKPADDQEDPERSFTSPRQQRRGMKKLGVGPSIRTFNSLGDLVDHAKQLTKDHDHPGEWHDHYEYYKTKW